MLVVDDVDPSTYRCAYAQQQQQLQLAQQQGSDVNTDAEVDEDENEVGAKDEEQGGCTQEQESQQFHQAMSQQQYVSALATPPSTPMAETAVHVHSHTAKTPTLMAARCVAPPTGVTPMMAPSPTHAPSEVAPWSAGSAASTHVPQHPTPQPMQQSMQHQHQHQQHYTEARTFLASIDRNTSSAAGSNATIACTGSAHIHESGIGSGSVNTCGREGADTEMMDIEG